MPKRILLLTAGNKGGHRSASNAIKKALLEIDSSIMVDDYDSNKLFLGYKESTSEQGYITLTTRFRLVWKIFFEFTSFFRRLSNFCLYLAIKRNFTKLLREEKPDIVISLHPCFVGSIIKILKKTEHTPFYVVVLDPVKHSSLWRDKRTDLTFLPVAETKDSFIKEGFKEDSLVQCGFPLTFSSPTKKRNFNDKRRLLFVNPSQRSLKKTRELIEVAFAFDVEIDVITGSDFKLKKYLEKHLSKNTRINIYGYVDDMNYRLNNSDIVLTKAGPNIMFEAIAAATPIILTGHLPGQEDKNYTYVLKRGYGYKAEKPKELFNILKTLLIDEPNLLEKISENERNCPDLNGAKNIAEIILKR